MTTFQTLGPGLPDIGVDLSLSAATATAAWSYDITRFVRLYQRTEYGRQDYLTQIGAAKVTLVLDNRDRRFDPSYTSGPHFGGLKPLRRIRVQMRYAGVTYPRCVVYTPGWSQAYPGQGSDSTVTLECFDAFGVANLARFPAGWARVEERSDLRLTACLDLLGVPGGDRSLETGIATVAAVAAGDLDNRPILPHMLDVAEAEGGPLWVNGAGTWTFQNRYHRNVLESNRNLITNPSFEVDASGWGVNDGTIVRSTAQAHDGAASGKFTCTVVTNPFVYWNMTLAGGTAGRTFAAGIWVYGDASVVGEHANLILRESGGAAGVQDSVYDFTFAAGWTNYTVARTLAQNDRNLLQLIIDPYTAGVAVNDFFYIDGAQVVEVIPTFGDVGTGKLPYRDAEFVDDESELWNAAQVTPASGVIQEHRDGTASPPTGSIGEYFERDWSRSLPMSDDYDALARGQYVVARQKDPRLRCPHIDVLGQADPTRLWPVLLSLDISKQIGAQRFTGTSPLTAQGYIEGLTEGPVKPGSYPMSLEISPADNTDYWTLNTSVLGTSTVVSP